MLAKVYSCAVVGLDGVLVEVEVDVGTGNPGMIVVGLPDAAVQESKERVRSAIRNSGGRFPHGRVTVNLAPADLKKAGPTYDLPIALGILIAGKQLQAPPLDDAVVVGELSLDGVVRHTPGIIAMVVLAAQKGMRRAFVPAADAPEAAPWRSSPSGRWLTSSTTSPVRPRSRPSWSGKRPMAPSGRGSTSPTSRGRSTSSGGWR